MYKKFKSVHFVGIGGIGMSGIAEVLNNLGYEVHGSDLRDTETTRRLRELGINIKIGQSADNLINANVVVTSSAVSPDNPEVEAARKMSIPVIPRAEMLAELARLKYAILVAGAHGKTTTTSLIASVLGDGKFDPTVVIGGKLKGIGSNAKLGQGEFLVAEADESDGSFLKLSPTIAVVTNIDREHMDYFKSIEEIKSAFLSFINKVPFYGLCILNGDNEYMKELLPKVSRRFITYGLSEGLDLVAKNIRSNVFNAVFDAELNGKLLGTFEVPLAGDHNISNGIAAVAVANELGMNVADIQKALKNFSGVHRRLEMKGLIKDIEVIDDYGHHPTEIIATLKAVKEVMAGEPDRGRLVVLFQPHRYSRTRDLLEEFIDAFGDADKVLLMDIYPAGEKPLPGVNSDLLYRGIKETKVDVEYIDDREQVQNCLDMELKSGDVLLTLGAGDVWKEGEKFIRINNSE